MVLDGQLTDRDLLAQTRGSERFDGTPRPVWALLSDGYKVIFDERAGTVEVYHLESDPAERHDLADREPLRARALLQRLLAQRYRSEMDFARSERGAGRAARRESAPTASLSWLCALGGPIFPDVTAGAVGPGPIMPPMGTVNLTSPTRFPASTQR